MKKERYLQQSALFLFFFLLLLIAYIPSFQGDWHFDDLPNILENIPLHLTDLTPQSLQRTFFAYPEQEGTFLRPVSNLSFALNWFFHQDKVFGYHLVNFFIHFLTTVFLFKSCLLLLSSPKIKGRVHGNPFVIATLAALFWALNPVQTQAVTYIVQRMASLAAMFTIIGIWCYLKARRQQGDSIKKQFFYYAGLLFAFLLALGSKENAILLPASLVLIELFFFRETIKLSKQNIVILALGFLFVLGFTILLKGPDVFHKVFSSYATRSFTPGQRVLTESRIVLFYLTLLFFPAPFRLSLIHDIQLSTSLFNPISTLFAVVTIGVLVILPFFFHKRFPLLSFALLFFFLNHIVESTFLNLKLIFEHRNYLPSFYLFLPVASLIGALIHQYRKQQKSVYCSLIGMTTLLVFFLLIGTLTRNKVWLTEQSLWADTVEKAPNNSGPYINLGLYYLLHEHNYQKAFELNFLSLDKYSATPWKTKFWAYNNLGYIMMQIGNYEKALHFYDAALKESQATTYGIYNARPQSSKAKVLWKTGQKDEAVQIMDQLTRTNPKQTQYLQQYGEMLIGMNRGDEGIALLQHVLADSNMMSKTYRNSLIDFALIYARLGLPEKSFFYINFAHDLGAPTVSSLLCFIEISLLATREDKADKTMRHLLLKITWAELIAILEETSPNPPALPLNYRQLRRYAEKWILQQQTQ
ncbi:Tetratricopeptide repeat-containing protein [Candidatus Electrothrix marina]|uniref:Tetratricopeptide repeat-containing protein n=1 Tax=Candidatus Electrothrix marina TaxID=1859130 RepID=A0A444J813_9BACT|nr:Tetratricopeptide repeat-containing protein [Candidatus Electrothrix marina]